MPRTNLPHVERVGRSQSHRCMTFNRYCRETELSEARQDRSCHNGQHTVVQSAAQGYDQCHYEPLHYCRETEAWYRMVNTTTDLAVCSRCT